MTSSKKGDTATSSSMASERLMETILLSLKST